MNDSLTSQPRRRSIRLPNYDYAQAGAYFVTICTHNRQCLFGEISDSEMYLNDFGKMVLECWNDLPNHYGHIELDAFVIMPNHVHGIVVLLDVGAGLKPASTMKRHSLSEIVRGFKTFSARTVNHTRGTRGVPVWQRGFYEHIIRNEDDLARIREYVVYNPAKWPEDELNPDK